MYCNPAWVHHRTRGVAELLRPSTRQETLARRYHQKRSQPGESCRGTWNARWAGWLAVRLVWDAITPQSRKLRCPSPTLITSYQLHWIAGPRCLGGGGC